MILVTGGAGFIGSHVVDLLVEAGHEVRILDHLHPAAHSGPPAYVNPAAEWIRADVRDLDAARRAVDGVLAVSHQASMVGLGVDFADAPDYADHNGVGTAVLLRALFERGFGGRLVLASSMVVYGEGRYACEEHGVVAGAHRSARDLDAGRFEPPCPLCGRELRSQSVPEGAPLDPRSVYAATKLHQEHLVNAFAGETGAHVTSLRYHNVYGPRMPRDTPYAGVASIFRSRLEAGEAPLVFEDGGQRRDFVHVHDVARANLLALTAPEPVTGPLNVATGDVRTVMDMARALHAAYPAGTPDPQVTGRWRAGDVRHVHASTDRIRETLGFEPEIAFERGMRDFATAELRA
jgi:dTDP-L-rhamnose 4-epimerase